jgi:hypothetical protein
MEIPYIEGCWQGQKNLHCKLKDIKNEDLILRESFPPKINLF